MIPYISLIISLGCIGCATYRFRNVDFCFLFASLVLVAAFLGLRYEVGPDWGSYQARFLSIDKSSWKDLVFGDLFYSLLSLTISNSGFSFAILNLTCSALACAFLFFGLKNSKYAFLQLALLSPVIITYNGMTHNRMFISLAVLFYFFTSLKRYSRKWSLINLILAVGFHKFSVLAAIALLKGVGLYARILIVSVIISLAYIMYQLVGDYLFNAYIRDLRLSSALYVRFAWFVIIWLILRLALIMTDRISYWTIDLTLLICGAIILVFGPLTLLDRLLPILIVFAIAQLDGINVHGVRSNVNILLVNIMSTTVSLVYFLIWSFNTSYYNSYFPYKVISL